MPNNPLALLKGWGCALLQGLNISTASSAGIYRHRRWSLYPCVERQAGKLMQLFRPPVTKLFSWRSRDHRCQHKAHFKASDYCNPGSRLRNFDHFGHYWTKLKAVISYLHTKGFKVKSIKKTGMKVYDVCIIWFDALVSSGLWDSVPWPRVQGVASAGDLLSPSS